MVKRLTKSSGEQEETARMLLQLHAQHVASIPSEAAATVAGVPVATTKPQPKQQQHTSNMSNM